MPNSTILKIAVFSPLRQCFDYLPPDDFACDKIKPGMRALVPFGSRELVGLVIEITSSTKINTVKLKKVKAILDNEPLLPKSIFELIKWTADYYHHPLGDTISNAIPAILRKKPKKTCNKKNEYNQILTKNNIKTSKILAKSSSLSPTKLVLNKDQKLAISEIVNNEGFQTFLLYGVTGSGKTEVYLNAIEKIIAEEKQALVLVPEINLTPQTLARFSQRFSVEIAVLHSRKTDKERFSAWKAAKNGEAKIIIGTRSAVFTPIKNPGIIILDEEHDLSFKQQSGLRYSARDLAVIRGKLENVPVVLGSATPSLESINNAKLNRYKILTLPKRAGNANQPTFNVIDMRRQKIIDGLSEELIHVIEKHLANEEQILIFINRRGYAPVYICPSCGLVVDCKQCSARMVLHRETQKLHCHHCNNAIPIPQKCDHCAQTPLIPLGFGTERIEENLNKLFPNTVALRVDQDSTRNKNALENMLEKIHLGDVKILVGTQMLAKGHHFPDVTLVAIINIDNSLYNSDFRASEHLAQLITQVSGRAGREEKPGEVYLQTFSPKNPMLLHLLAKGYKDFTDFNLEERKKAFLPPFSYTALIRAENKNKSKTLHFLQELRSQCEIISENKVKVLGPIFAAVEKKAGFYRAQLMLQSKKRSLLHDLLNKIIPQIESQKKFGKMKWSVDVDPIDVMS